MLLRNSLSFPERVSVDRACCSHRAVLLIFRLTCDSVFVLGTNSCASASCSHLCLLSASGPRFYSCTCPSGWTLSSDHVNCMRGRNCAIAGKVKKRTTQHCQGKTSLIPCSLILQSFGCVCVCVKSPKCCGYNCCTSN